MLSHKILINLFLFRYNCEDPNCYLDLARLRGIKYITWENKTVLHQQDEVCNKFSNKTFDSNNLIQLLLGPASRWWSSCKIHKLFF